MHFIIRAIPIYSINGTSHKFKLKAAEIIQLIMQSQNHAASYVFYVLTGLHTHICILINVIARNQAHIALTCIIPVEV